MIHHKVCNRVLEWWLLVGNPRDYSEYKRQTELLLLPGLNELRNFTRKWDTWQEFCVHGAWNIINVPHKGTYIAQINFFPSLFMYYNSSAILSHRCHNKTKSYYPLCLPTKNWWHVCNSEKIWLENGCKKLISQPYTWMWCNVRWAIVIKRRPLYGSL